MPRGASNYAISQLIYRVFRDSGLKRSQFITSLGYRNITGGLRSLDRWLDTGTGDPLLIERLIRFYKLDPAVVRDALLETEAQHHAESQEAHRRREQWDREHFRQFVFVETPAGILQDSFIVAALAAPALKTISLPDHLRARPEPDQIRYVSALIQAHFVRRGGKLPLFGPIVGYRFVIAYDESIRFNTNGTMIEGIVGHFAGPGGSIQIGRKTVAPAMLLRILGGLQCDL